MAKQKYHTEEQRREAKREYDRMYKRIYRPRRRKTARVAVERPLDVPIGVVRDRAMRLIALDQRTPSQVICGEPPPGYSALDQKNGKHP